MSDELPEWMEEFPEAIPDDIVSQLRKSKKDEAVPQVESSSKKFPLTVPQITILAGLFLTFCFICMGIGGVLYFNLGADPDSPSQEVVVAPSVEIPTATPGPSPTPTNTPIPSPPLALVEPTATPAPSPTATYAVAPEFINKDKIADIIEFVEASRGLVLPEDVPIKFLARHQLREQWRDEAFDVAVLEAIQTQQQFYTALGLIEPDVDWVEAAFSSQTNILLGYYTPEEKAMYIIAESVNMFAQEEMTFAHEYVHALQDYHFDLSTILDEELSGDALLATRSLPEGDARLVEDLFTLENIEPTQVDYTVYRYLFEEQIQLEGVSPALGIFTNFPYTAGEYFVIYLFIEGDYSWGLVNQAYSNPPVSSEQVMHPEKYLAGEVPIPIPMPDLAPVLGDPWRELDRDVLGEAGFLVWLIDQVEDQVAIDAAAGWEGDTYTLWTNEANQRVLAESSLWESEADAIEFMETFVSYMNSREGNAAWSEEAGTHFWEYEEGITAVSRQDRQVLIIVAPDRVTLDNVGRQFSQF